MACTGNCGNDLCSAAFVTLEALDALEATAEAAERENANTVAVAKYAVGAALRALDDLEEIAPSLALTLAIAQVESADRLLEFATPE